MAQNIYQHTLPNGMTLLAERMPHVRSAALNFLLPAGYIYDPPDQLGMASVLSEVMTRGAGDRDSRALTLALDNLGLDRSESVGAYNMRFWGATLSRNLPAALEIYADILRRPQLPDKEVDPVKQLALQDLMALEDSPHRKVFVELGKLHYPEPLGRDQRGTTEGIRNITADKLRNQWQRLFGPRDVILSVAGNIDWSALQDQVERLFGDWQGDPPPDYVMTPTSENHAHLPKETTQTHIALAYDSVPRSHDDYYVARGAVNVLSGGMSSRLFTEVREKRGLCYSVGVSYSPLKDRGSIIGYAGTTNDRAQETLDVTIQELQRMQDGVEEEEVQRVRAGLKSSLIMQEESTSARAGALAADWFFLARVRTLSEIEDAIDRLSPERIVDHVRRYPPKDFTIVTLGPEPLKLPQN